MRKLEEEAREKAKNNPDAGKKSAQQAVEDADVELSKELFSGFVDTSGGSSSGGGGGDFTIGNPQTEAEYLDLGVELGKRLLALEGSKHYFSLLKVMLKEATAEMRSDQVKDVQASLNVVYNNRIKEERGPKKNKKKKKKNIKVARGPIDDVDDDYFNDSGEFDDFM
eukprot:TRINITY_DN2241_c0_g1_i2.p3 TRINITY_DN2241_c0_g1~~TRINITY_DN2241_c0_g1_i2.p3  ORF type:complete len:167 (-),score=78.66 TRINITY_DN2241_c0_g1_i2:386-886(-)